MDYPLHQTNEYYSPHDLLPAPEPSTCDYPEWYFYHNVAKHLVKDTVRIMNNGLNIDMHKVELLEEHLDEVLTEVTNELANNQLITEFQSIQYEKLIVNYIDDRKAKLRTPDYYAKPFKHSDMNHRSYFMYLFATKRNIEQPKDLLPTDIPKWNARLVKKLSTSYPLLVKLIDGTISATHPIVIEAMELLVKHKCDMYNQKYIEQIHNPILDVPAFNPGSSKQKQELFEWLEFEPKATSKDTGLPSWGRDQVEEVNKETTNEDIKHFTQQFIDHSFAAIVRNNFIKAFYTYTVDGRLYGQYKLLGAKSGRYTSSNPNMLNMPSTRSIFAKPIKKCFTAPEGFVIAAIDYAALEDRVIANLSRDTNKVNLFLQNLDGHCLNAYGYFLDEIAQYMEITGDTTTDVIKFKELCDTVPELAAIRQKGKPATFGLSYGSFPPKVASTLKIELTAAEKIFYNYHHTLYPGITEYRENYVLSSTKQNGYIHLGLGFNLHSDYPDRDIRTLNNATAQVWSILTVLAINKLHQLIDDNGLQNDIIITSTIYDSCYFEVRDDPEIIQWLNNNIVPTMEQDFMEGQLVPNSVDLELGPDWSTLHKLSHDASIEEIEHTLETINEKSTS